MDEATRDDLFMALSHAQAGVNVLATLAATGDVEGLREGTLYSALDAIERRIGDALEKLPEAPDVERAPDREESSA
jgi:hypothetical protein